MIVTTGELYRIMFSTDPTILNNILNNSKILCKDTLNFTEYELNKPKTKTGTLALTHTKSETERRLKFFDFAIDDDYMEHKGDDIRYEILLCQDISGTVHVLNGANYGNKFKSYASLRIREKVA